MTAVESVRLDRWLWATRFFKTRGLAKAAIDGGKIHLNGARAKPARTVQPGDALTINRGDERHEVTVLATGTRRVSAALAAEMYEETPESSARREAQAEQRRLQALDTSAPDRRPDKRARRALRRIKGR